MKNTISLSGGKDSTAMLLWSLEKGEHFDEVIFFDGGWEFPEMEAHIERLKKLVPITTVKPDKPFDWYAFERPIGKGNNKGLIGYGFPNSVSRWCTWYKTDTIRKYIIQAYGDEPVRSWVGIAADETKRVKEKELKAGAVRYPLIEWGKTEADCLEYCKSKGYDWGGLYDHMHRVSCWCCPLQPLQELYVLWRDHPELWERLREMQEHSIRPFRKDYSFYGLECKFKARYEGEE